MPKKRANGEGSIRLRADGRWEGRYSAGYDPITGKTIRKNVLGKSREEVAAKLRQALMDAQILDMSQVDEYTVATWVETWYDIYARPNIRENTRKYYRGFIDRFIIPQIGHIKLKKLTSRDLQRMYNNVREHGRSHPDKNGQHTMSDSYVHGLHVMMKGCLERAAKERLILRNPAQDCIPPKIKRTEMKILKPDQLGVYLRTAQEFGVLPLFFLELCTGLRKGELCALLWEDLNVEAKTLRVNKQALREKGGGVTVVEPKTATSVREIAVSDQVIEILRTEHEKHPDNPYLIPSPRTGRMYHPDSIAKLHRKILEAAGLPHIRLHDLRHTFATLALQSGVDIRTVSGMLGHADPGFTLRTYTHTTNPQQVKAAAALGNIMAGSL